MLKSMNRAALAVMLVVAAQAPAWAQLTSAADGPVVYGHHHVNATSVDAHKKFWVDGLGGTRIKWALPHGRSSSSRTCSCS